MRQCRTADPETAFIFQSSEIDSITETCVQLCKYTDMSYQLGLSEEKDGKKDEGKCCILRQHSDKKGEEIERSGRARQRLMWSDRERRKKVKGEEKEEERWKEKQISLFSAACSDIERYVGTNVPESLE